MNDPAGRKAKLSAGEWAAFCATCKQQFGFDPLTEGEVTAVNKTASGLLKLLYPDAEAHIPDTDLEWAVRVALECRRRVQEQQKRIGSAEFQNTQFSYRLGVPMLLAFCSALLARSLRGGLVIVGGLSIGGSFEPIHNAVSIAELMVEKGAQTILFPVSARRQLNDLSDEMAACITIVYYVDVRDALLKSIAD
ncbi:MAG: peptidase [Chthonomonadales bacterium]|nr:peptidase [Chthonomonadales bacterium]